MPIVRQQLTMSAATPMIRTAGKRRTFDSALTAGSDVIRIVWPRACCPGQNRNAVFWLMIATAALA